METVKSWLSEFGLGASADIVVALIATVAVLTLSAVTYFIARQIVLRLVRSWAKRSRTTWDDALVEARVFSRLSHLVPAMILNATAGWTYQDFPAIQALVGTAVFVYMALVGMTVFDALLNAFLVIYRSFRIASRIEIKPIVQVVKILVFFSGGVSILAILLGKSPLVFFSGLGAFTAVLLLIFKDTILSLVASIQITSNNLVHVGDWIEMPKYGADGDVMEVALTTVKVRNFDKTITTVPTHRFIEEGFKNWRGMSQSGGRRIKRAIFIDAASIRFLTTDEVDTFERWSLLSGYIRDKKREIAEYNASLADNASVPGNDNASVPGNGNANLPGNGGVAADLRQLTNIGTFRAYIYGYLRNHPKIHNQGFTLLAREGDRASA